MGITPPFDRNRYELVDDPEKIKLEEYLDTLDENELDEALSDESLVDVLQRPKILVEKPRFTQLSLFY